MTTPNGVSTGFNNDDTDFLKAKVDRSGAMRMQAFSLPVADDATAGTIYGLVPFQKGARFCVGASSIYVPDLDTASNVTINVGYIYDNNTDNTNDTDAFASALTTAQTGGYLVFDEEEGLDFQATADGYICLELAAGPVTTAGTIEGQIVLAYD